jgi:uncharacterized membrane protein YadS
VSVVDQADLAKALDALASDVKVLAAQARHAKIACSFCGRDNKQAKELIAGPGVYICGECAVLCVEIVAEHAGEPVDGDSEETLP